MARRRGARRTGRRTARRTTRRVMRRRMRRRVMVGGMVLLAVGGTAAAIKLTQKDAQRIEEHTGGSVEELSEEELMAAMKDLGIQSSELSAEDKAALAQDAAQGPVEAEETAPAEQTVAAEQTAAATSASTADAPDYIRELQLLAQLRDQGILTDEEFEAKKKQILSG